jgi:hypothetical protein
VLRHDVQDRVERLCAHLHPDLAQYIANHKGDRKAPSMGPTDQQRLEQAGTEINEMTGAMAKFDPVAYMAANLERRTSIFRRAPIMMKPVILALEPESKAKMLDRLEDAGERARTLLAYTRSTGDTLPLQFMSHDDLREMFFYYTDDPRTVGELFSYLPPLRQADVAIALNPQQLAHFAIKSPIPAFDVIGQLTPETKTHTFDSMSSAQLVAFYQALDPQWRKDVVLKWLSLDKLNDLALSIPEVKPGAQNP